MYNEKFCYSRENYSTYSCFFEYRKTFENYLKILLCSRDIQAPFFSSPYKIKFSKRKKNIIIFFFQLVSLLEDRIRICWTSINFSRCFSARNYYGERTSPGLLTRKYNYSRGMNFKVGLIKDSITSWWALARN